MTRRSDDAVGEAEPIEAATSARGTTGSPRTSLSFSNHLTPEAAIGPQASERSGLSRATATTYGAQIAVSVLSLANVLVIARTLGPAGRGDVAFLAAVAWLTAFCFTMSAHEAMANRAAIEPKDRPELAGSAVVLAAFLGTAGAAAAYVAVNYVPFLRLDVDGLALVAALVAIPVLILQTYFSYLVRAASAVGAANMALIVTALGVTFNAALAVLGLLTSRNAVFVWTGAQVLSVVVLGAYLCRCLGSIRAPSRPLLGHIARFAIRAHGAGLTNSATYRIDSWILGAIAGPHQLGVYSVAVAWFEGLFLLPQAVSMALRPTIAKATDDRGGRLAAGGCIIAVVLTALMGGGLYLLAPVLCVGVFGPEFRDAVPLLRLLIPGAVGIATLKILGSALTARARPWLESAASACAFGVAVAMYVILIPRFGAAGAAVASTVAYLIGGATAGVIFARTFGRSGRDLVPTLSQLISVMRIGPVRAFKR